MICRLTAGSTGSVQNDDTPTTGGKQTNTQSRRMWHTSPSTTGAPLQQRKTTPGNAPEMGGNRKTQKQCVLPMDRRWDRQSSLPWTVAGSVRVGGGGNRSFIVWRFMPPPRHGSTMVVTLRNERLCFMYQMGLPPQQVYSPLVRTILGPGGPCARGGGGEGGEHFFGGGGPLAPVKPCRQGPQRGGEMELATQPPPSWGPHVWGERRPRPSGTILCPECPLGRGGGSLGGLHPDSRGINAAEPRHTPTPGRIPPHKIRVQHNPIDAL